MVATTMSRALPRSRSWRGSIRSDHVRIEIPPFQMRISSDRDRRPVPWVGRTGSAVTSGRFLNLSGMPLFEFACRQCGHRFETLVTGNRAPECPECRSADLEKLVSAFAARTSGDRATSATRSPFT